MKVNSIVLSPFSVNTYIVSDQTDECVIIDPSCYDQNDRYKLKDFIDKNSLKPVMLINTHSHLDHIFGNNFVQQLYGIDCKISKFGQEVYKRAHSYAKNYGLSMDSQHEPGELLDESNVIKFGNSELRILHVPGHSPGSLIFYSPIDKFAIVGDVIFSGSIGRTDLPGGDFDTLISGIKQKVYKLAPDTVLYPEHGESTTVEREIRTNPFTK